MASITETLQAGLEQVDPVLRRYRDADQGLLRHFKPSKVAVPTRQLYRVPYLRSCGGVQAKSIMDGGNAYRTWRIAIDGHHAHSRFNPMGLRFHIRLFKEATGAVATGPAHASFTWFPGFDWRMAGCRKCRTHLGWRYEGKRAPRVFFGLIRDRLSASHRNPEA